MGYGHEHWPQLWSDHGSRLAQQPLWAWTSSWPHDRIGHRDWYGSNGDVTLRCQHGSRQQPRTLALPLMVSEATDINTDPESSRATDSDMAPLAAHAWKSPWHLVPVQAGHSDLYDRGCSMTLRSPTGLRRWSRPSASPWLWWQHRSMDINTDPSCSGARYGINIQFYGYPTGYLLVYTSILATHFTFIPL